eukprot:1851515-Amphidinium_carterae.3
MSRKRLKVGMWWRFQRMHLHIPNIHGFGNWRGKHNFGKFACSSNCWQELLDIMFASDPVAEGLLVLRTECPSVSLHVVGMMHLFTCDLFQNFQSTSLFGRERERGASSAAASKFKVWLLGHHPLCIRVSEL